MATKNSVQAARQMESRLVTWMAEDLNAGFNAAVTTYQGLLLRAAHNVLDSTPHLAHMAEDVVQDGLINALLFLRAHPEFLKKPNCHFRNWLVTIIQNQALHCLKAGEDHITLNAGVLGEEIEEAIEEGYVTHYGDPVLRLERMQSRMEARRITREQLATLSSEARVAVEQKYLRPDSSGKEKTYNQVAKELNEPVNTIKSRVNRSLKKMRQQLDQKTEQSVKQRDQTRKTS